MDIQYEQLAAEFRAFKNMLKQKYEGEYLSKMNVEEQEKYVEMSSALNKNNPEQVRQDILRSIDYTNTIATAMQQGSYTLMSAQAEVTKIHANIQEMLNSHPELSEQEEENYREQLNDILAIPGENLNHLAAKIGYLKALEESISGLSKEDDNNKGLGI